MNKISVLFLCFGVFMALGMKSFIILVCIKLNKVGNFTQKFNNYNQLLLTD